MEPAEQIAYTLTQWTGRKPGYDTYRAYAEGQHQLTYATEDFAAKYGAQVKHLRENLCEAAYTVFTDRLAVESWGDTAAVDTMTEEGLGRVLGLVFDESFRCGDAYILVWYGSDGQPTPHYHRADEMVPHIDPIEPGRLDWAAKPWIDADHHGRINIYDDAQVTRWRTSNRLTKDATLGDVPLDPRQWVEHADDDGGPVIPHDFGAVPVCWMPQASTQIGGYGRSILTDVIPLQDATNKSLADLIITAEAYSRPLRYLLNYRPEGSNPLAMAGDYMTAVGRVVGAQVRKFDPRRQQIFTHDGGGPFGQLDPADLSQLIAVQDAFAIKIGRVIGVPPFYITQVSGDVPSGESLRILASRMTARIRRFQRDATPVLRGLAQLLGIDDPQIAWADPMGLDEMERWTRAQIQQTLGYPLEDILRDLGEPDVEGVMQRAAAAQATNAAAIGKALRDGEIGY